MYAHKPATPKMVLALNKGPTPTAKPAPATGGLSKPPLKPAATKRPAPAAAAIQKPAGNRPAGPTPAPAASKPAASNISVKPITTLPLPPAKRAPSLSNPIAWKSPQANELAAVGLPAGSLGSSIGAGSKLRIADFSEIASAGENEQADICHTPDLFEITGIVDSLDQDDPTEPEWKIVASDIASNRAEIEYWPDEDESKERIRIGSSYRFIGQVRKSPSKIVLVAVAIKECTMEDAAVMTALQKVAEMKKNEA